MIDNPDANTDYDDLVVERRDLLATLAEHRFFLLHTARDLTDAQARQRSTVSELCVGGTIKHVARMEGNWRRFIIDGPTALGQGDEAGLQAHVDSFRMGDDETLAAIIERYTEGAAAMDDLVRSLPDLDAEQPLPDAPWFEPGNWSARRAILHVIAETAQHAGHADIVRESIDGAKSMG